jgi:hypothetical protein
MRGVGGDGERRKVTNWEERRRRGMFKNYRRVFVHALFIPSSSL